MRPILKWAGGKARLARLISGAFVEPCRGTYYEPFVGSAAVFLYRRTWRLVGRSVLADVNSKLIEVHRAVRDDVDGVLGELATMPHADHKERYYEIREQFNAGPWVGPAHAARFIWLNRAGFNGLYRENRKGGFNVPVGSYATLSFPSEDHFRTVSVMLQGVELRVADFREILEEAETNDQVYCDPPYVPLTNTANFTGYSKLPFGMEEQIALAEASLRAAERGACVVLSNHDCPEVRQELYRIADGFRHVATPKVTRAISRKSASRKGVGEIIAAVGPTEIEAA